MTSHAAASAAPDVDDPLALVVDDLRYQLDRAPSRGGRKVVVVVRRSSSSGDDGPPLVDRADLYAHRARARLAALVSETFGRASGEVLGHLAVLLDQVERAGASEATTSVTTAMTATQRRAAEKLLGARDLLDRVARGMEALGHVGEERTKRLVYLAATSRLMATPLNVLLLAPSGAGKSSVLDAVTAVLPPEAVVAFTRLTPAALGYMGADALAHKLIVVDEYDGQAEAEHAVRVLQSRGELRTTRTAPTGRTETVVVRGPVAVMSGSVSTTIDRQSASRCLELALDDSAEQTRRIQAMQARRAAGETGARVDVQPLVDAQRLLEPLEVVIPYATKLAFPARTTTDRRASAKLLGLIQAHALLHQRQRERDAEGRVVATSLDYATVHALVAPQLDRDVEGLSPRATRAHQLLAERGAALSKREVAEAAGWSYHTADRAVRELVEQELATLERRLAPRTYRLVAESALGAVALTPPGDLG